MYILTQEEFEKEHSQSFGHKIVDQKFGNVSISKLFSNINGDDVLNTFKYIFYKIQKGIFLKFGNDCVDQFLIFNSDEPNEWGKLISYNQNLFSELFNKSKKRFKIYYDPSLWKTNNGLMRFENPHIEHNHHVEILQDMFNFVSKERKVAPGLEIFLNKRDFPIITNNAEYEPYYNIYDNRYHKLVSHKYAKYAPICSFSKQDEFDDILIPSYEDWARVRSLEDGVIFPKMFRDYTFKSVQWSDKIDKAVFRGSSTGIGLNSKTNTRLALVKIKHDRLDAGITKLNNRLVKGINSNLDFLREDVQLVKKLTFQEQLEYKIIIHVEGHVSAFRLGLELAGGSCIIIVQSEWKCWFSHMLIPYVHFIPVRKDLSDLTNVLDWCFDNDAKISKIAQNALEFYNTNLTKNKILDYLENVLNSVSYCVGSYSYPRLKWKDFLIEKNILPFKSDDEIPWLIDEKLSKKINPINFRNIHFKDQLNIFFQIIVMFQYLQWHHCMYLPQFDIVVEECQNHKFKISELYDHYFTSNYKISIITDFSKLFYVTKDNLTNYNSKIINHNMIDILKFFQNSHTVLLTIIFTICKLFQENPNKSVVDFESLKQFTSFSITMKFIYDNIYPIHYKTIGYERRLPKPLVDISKHKPDYTYFYQHQFPCNINTNKLIVYRQLQIAHKLCSVEILQIYKDLLKRLKCEPLEFNIINFGTKEISDFKNDTTYLRIIYELLYSNEFITKEDLTFYTNLFKPLLKLDKVLYSIQLSQLQTILLFHKEQ